LEIYFGDIFVNLDKNIAIILPKQTKLSPKQFKNQLYPPKILELA